MDNKKTIGIDARFYGEAGPGRYAKNIVNSLEKIDQINRYIVFLRKAGFEQYTPSNPNFVKVLADYKWYTFDEQIRFLISIYKQKIDLLYVPHFNIPVLYVGKLVTAIPDIIMHTFSTEEGTTLPPLYFKFKKFVYKVVVAWAVIRSKKVIVPSNTVKEDFLKVFPFARAEKFAIAYEGIDPDFSKSPSETETVMAKYEISKPFLLYVGSMYKHKNVETLIEAYKILKTRFGYNGHLVLIGKKDHFSNTLFEKIDQEGLRSDIIMPGQKWHVTDNEVVVFRKEAQMYVFPSLKEGFSLTPLEGMCHGLAAVISDIPCHREIYGNCVQYFDPNNVEDVADKVYELLVNTALKETLIQKGLELTKKYSWRTTAQLTLEIFTEALKN